jgi:hypothetical protein
MSKVVRFDFPLPPILVPLLRDWRLCMWRALKAVSCHESSMLDVFVYVSKVKVYVLMLQRESLGLEDDLDLDLVRD